MEEALSLNYNSIENELDFDGSQVGVGQNFHAKESDSNYSLTRKDEMNNNNGTEKTLFPNFTSTWLSDFTSVENSERFRCIDDEMIIDASEGFPDKTDRKDLANGLNISHLNIENRNDFISSQAADTNDRQFVAFIGDDFDFSKCFDLVEENTSKTRKTTETSTSSDEMNGFVKALGELDQTFLEMPKDRTVESAYFELRKPKHFGLVSDDDRENMNCIQTDPKRIRTNINYTVDAGELSTTNLASSEGMIQLFSMTGRGSYGNARTRKCQSERGFSTKFEDFNPVPSPEAEVPSLSPITTNKYIKDDELITLDTKELNRRVKPLPKVIVQEIKNRRRTLKNRGYARSCRQKKNNETSTLQKSNGELEKEVANKNLELQLAMLQRDDWKNKCEQLASALQQPSMQVEP